MQPATDPEELVAWYDGRYVSGRTWIVYSVDAQLFGQIHWGAPDAEDFAHLLAVWELELRATTPRHASLIDLRRLTALEPALFSRLASRLGRMVPIVASKITQQAILPPTDPAIAALGASTTLGYPHASFADLEPALEWLGRRDALSAIRALGDHARPASELLTSLAAYLRNDLVHANIDSAAFALGISRRTLQRRLTDENTTFLAEQQRARIERAQELLAASDRDVHEIAVEVCGSAPKFNDLFRRTVGMTALAWRSRTRR